MFLDFYNIIIMPPSSYIMDSSVPLLNSDHKINTDRISKILKTGRIIYIHQYGALYKILKIHAKYWKMGIFIATERQESSLETL